MQTKPNQTDPAVLDTLLKALLQDNATLPGIAARMQFSMADLLELIERPDVQRSLQRLRTALTQRRNRRPLHRNRCTPEPRLRRR
ncbi:MAG: hypothetical protein ACFHWZ_10890 [Phycisphaerales bacterium]